MRGVSEVIAIILILMITISLAGLAYMFMSTTMSDVTSSAGSTVDTTTTSMLTSFTIESLDVAKVYVRNTGQNIITSLSVYVNDEPATYNVTTPIAVGTVGTITIYSFIPDGATVKVTSSSGFSTSKIAHPCSKAVGCWKFDEGSGNYTYDSSPNGNDGMLINGPTWTNGMNGGALRFDGINDYVSIDYDSSLNITGPFTISLWAYPIEDDNGYFMMRGSDSGTFSYGMCTYTSPSKSMYLWAGGTTAQGVLTSGNAFVLNRWNHILGIFNGTTLSVYVNGGLVITTASSGNLRGNDLPVRLGRYDVSGGSLYFNGTMDEIRIYNRAIY